MKLFLEAIFKFLFGLLALIALLFGAAGSFSYWQGWLFIGLLFIPILMMGIILFIKAPSLLKKRLSAKEKEGTQRSVLALSALLFIGGFILAGLDHRFGWSRMPKGIIFAAAAVLLISYLLYAEVLRENAYLSRIIEVQKGQTVIRDGLYGIVRHPMYAATIGLFLAIPFVLGSYWAALCFLPYLPLIAVRLLHEEQVLERDLSGYKEYKATVRWRLLPFIW